jgi:hypothetical protein
MPAGRWADWVEPSARPTHLDPLFPIDAFTPDSACPHRGKIRGGSSFCCMCCHEVNKSKAVLISLAAAPEPLEPEVRIARWRKLIEDGIFAKPEVTAINHRIADIQDLIDPGPRPTRYVPPPRPEKKQTRKQRRRAGRDSIDVRKG